MRIDPGNQNIPNIPPVTGRRPGRPAQRTSSAASSSVAASEQTSESAASLEIASLIAGLDDIPDVRSDLVEEVRQRLNRGEFLTRDAAEETAAAILADLASFIGQ